MKKNLFTLISFFFLVSYCYAGLVNYGNVLYWECSYCPDTYTGVIQHIRGDGETSIRVLPSMEEPEKIVESNRVLRLTYYDTEDGKDKYSTQYSGVEVWVDRKYVYIVSTIISYITKYNPKRGVISGNQSDINRYDFSGGNSSSNSSRSGSSSSSGRTCAGCHGTGKCTSCAGRGEYRGDGYYGTTIYDCPVCKGSGRCGVCYGKGVIR